MHRFSFNLPKDRKSSVGESGDIDDGDTAINDLVKKSTMKLLRNMSANLQSFGHLPEKAAMGIRLIYDDETPEDYNPPGFINCSPEELGNNFPGEKPATFRCGGISTAWHKVQVEALTKLDHLTQTLSQPQQSAENEEDTSQVLGEGKDKKRYVIRFEIRKTFFLVLKAFF